MTDPISSRLTAALLTIFDSLHSPTPSVSAWRCLSIAQRGTLSRLGLLLRLMKHGFHHVLLLVENRINRLLDMLHVSTLVGPAAPNSAAFTLSTCVASMASRRIPELRALLPCGTVVGLKSRVAVNTRSQTVTRARMSCGVRQNCAGMLCRHVNTYTQTTHLQTKPNTPNQTPPNHTHANHTLRNHHQL